MGQRVILEAPTKTINPLNIREHWRVRAKRVKRERTHTAMMLMGRKLPPLPVDIHMVRLSPGTLDDDAVPGAFKGIRDEIAAWFNLDDRDKRLRFTYGQAKGKLGVQITIGERNDA